MGLSTIAVIGPREENKGSFLQTSWKHRVIWPMRGWSIKVEGICLGARQGTNTRDMGAKVLSSLASNLSQVHECQGVLYLLWEGRGKTQWV